MLSITRAFIKNASKLCRYSQNAAKRTIPARPRELCNSLTRQLNLFNSLSLSLSLEHQRCSDPFRWLPRNCHRVTYRLPRRSGATRQILLRLPSPLDPLSHAFSALPSPHSQTGHRHPQFADWLAVQCRVAQLFTQALCILMPRCCVVVYAPCHSPSLLPSCLPCFTWLLSLFPACLPACLTGGILFAGPC